MIQNYFSGLLETWPTIAPLFQFFIIAFCAFIIEDPTTLFVGVLISLHKISFELGFAALSLGIYIGDITLYFIGVGIKKGFIKRHIKIKERKLPFSLLFMSRFIPGLRLVTYISAGFLQTSFKKFVLIITPSVFAWTLFLLWASDKTVQTTGVMEDGKLNITTPLILLGCFFIIEVIIGKVITYRHKKS